MKLEDNPDDDFLHVKSDGKDGAEIVAPQEQQQVDTAKGMLHELAEDVQALALAAAEQISEVAKGQATREIFWGAVALATGKMEEDYRKRPETPENVRKVLITDLVKDASIVAAEKAEDALAASLNREARALAVAAGAHVVSKATDTSKETSKGKGWSLFPSW
jgi:hypothetical protein